MTTLVHTTPVRTGAAAETPDLRASVFARFDLAYQATWPAEMGQFWAGRYPPGAAPYANLVHARNRRVRALLPGGEALLDVGSGYGDLLYLLRDKYRVLRGVDPSARSCAMATYNLESRSVGNDFSFQVGLAEELPFEDGAFDAVMCLDTYEHVEPAQRARALAEFFRVLRPGGRVIVVTPSRRVLHVLAAMDNVLTFPRQWKYRKSTGWRPHVFGLPKKDYCEVFCTRGELVGSLRGAGFTVDRFERCSFYPAPERGGFFYPFFEKLPAGHPRLRAAMRVVEMFERIGVFNQKMLAMAVKPGGGEAGSAASRYFLPAGYRERESAQTRDESGGDYWNAERIGASGRYQRHVYEWAARLVRERRLRSVLDVGCGPCVKLSELVAPVCADVEGVDQASAIAAARRLGARVALREIDLENCDGVAAWRTFDLIICADVIEHLLDPDRLLRLLGRLSHERTLILISTPDRARLRGRGCMASEKPEHVREWAEGEFVAFLRSRGFEIERVRRLPGDDAPVRRGALRDVAFALGLAGTSPHRCCTVLCRAGRG